MSEDRPALDITGPHWRFALSVYGTPGVPDACLLLQDTCGVDVNVLLIALFAAKSGRPLSAATVSAADEAVRAWRDEVVRPLREIRRRMKADAALAFGPDAEVVRNRVKAAELSAEQVEQAVLAGLIADNPPPAGAAVLEEVVRMVVDFYLGKGGAPDEAGVARAISTIAESAERVEARGAAA